MPAIPPRNRLILPLRTACQLTFWNRVRSVQYCSLFGGPAGHQNAPQYRQLKQAQPFSSPSPSIRISERNISYPSIYPNQCSDAPVESRIANLTSVLEYLEQERNRLGAQRERLNHAISVVIGTSNHRTRRTISAAGRARIRCRSVGKGQGAKGCFNPWPQRTYGVSNRPQKDCSAQKAC
jgi:hypothetical protein